MTQSDTKVCNVTFGVVESSKDENIPTPDWLKLDGEQDVKLSDKLDAQQIGQLQRIVGEHARIFSDVPGKTDGVYCNLELTTSNPIHVKQYPLPFATREGVEKEVQEMKKLGIIEKSVTLQFASDFDKETRQYKSTVYRFSMPEQCSGGRFRTYDKN